MKAPATMWCGALLMPALGCLLPNSRSGMSHGIEGPAASQNPLPLCLWRKRQTRQTQTLVSIMGVQVRPLPDTQCCRVVRQYARKFLQVHDSRRPVPDDASP